jgi:hypothetical protein
MGRKTHGSILLVACVAAGCGAGSSTPDARDAVPTDARDALIEAGDATPDSAGDADASGDLTDASPDAVTDEVNPDGPSAQGACQKLSRDAGWAPDPGFDSSGSVANMWASSPTDAWGVTS